MLQAQQILINQTVGNQLTFLLAWTLIMGIISFIFGLPIIKLFIDEINLIKNIITIIPISLFR
jgi:Na+-driven multidrug efflux pump